MSFQTADLIDMDGTLPACVLQFRSFGRRRRFHGPIRTIRCSEDNGLIRQAFAQPGNGKVLVVDGGGVLRCALVGDRVAELGMRNGWAGVIVNGAIRDSLAVDALDFGVKALGTNPRRPGQSGEGSLDQPVSFGGATFTPGHYLYSDEDGIVVSETAF